MPSTAYPPYQPPLFIVGPSSCGKTTLCDALAEDLQLHTDLYIREMARVVMRTQGFTRDDIPTYAMQNAIMMAQLRAEKDALRCKDSRSTVLFLSDRSAIDPVVYAATSGTEEAAEFSERLLRTPALQDNLPFYRNSLFIVLHAVPEWLVDDGVRSLKDPGDFNTHLCASLDELGIPFIEITSEVRDINDRVALVKRHLLARQHVHSPSKQSPSQSVARYRWRPSLEEDMGKYITITA